jgi:hypothetical protein
MRKVLRLVVVVVAVVLPGWGAVVSSASADSGVITGLAFDDLDRSGAYNNGEPLQSGVLIDLTDASGNYLATASTDAAGRYVFSGLADGSYTVAYDTARWWDIRNDWAPSTTGGSTSPRLRVSLSGTAEANFGWRRIVRSTTAGAPISTYTAASGARFESYDDVVTARQLADALASGSLLGAEAGSTTVIFDLGPSATTTSMGTTDGTGRYTNSTATSYVNYLSWLDTGDKVLFHEYGHAWSAYFARVAQQDPSFDGYLQARGLASDGRVGSSYAWDPAEMIAEDYRQLFGSVGAASFPQMNQDIPPAAAVAGLRTYLSSTFRTAPSTSPTPAQAPTTLSELSMNPNPVKTSGKASFRSSAATTATVQILDAKGTVVRTLLSNASVPAGTTTTAWDRKTATGQKAARGTSTLLVQATTAGTSVTARATFSAA